MSDLADLATSAQHCHDAPNPADARPTMRTMPELEHVSLREELAAVRLLDALDNDDRPSFAIRVQPAAEIDADAPLPLLYCNPALAHAERLLARITGPETASVFVEYHMPQRAFRKWLQGYADEHDSARRGNAYLFDGLVWTAVTVGQHKIVSGLHASLMWHDTLPGKPHESRSHSPKNMPVQGRLPALPSTPSETAYTSSSPETYGPFDYTFPDAPESVLSDHVKFFRSIDWAHTPLGSMNTWPAELRSVVNMCLNNIHPCMLFWGDDVTMIYNEAYIQLIGIMHPIALGKSARQIASDYWHSFQPLIDHINKTGQAVCDTEIPLFVDRHGFLEETYWSFEFIPVLDSRGHVAGYYHPLFETTKHNLLERRVSSLVELGSQTAKARTLQSYWELALHTLTLNDKDVPFALLYAAEKHINPDISSASSPGSTPLIETYLLKGAIGVEHGHPVAPASINVQDEAAGSVLQPLLMQAVKSRKTAILSTEQLGLSDSELNDIAWNGFGERCRTVVICPLLSTSEQVEGFLILGTNPRRPFDEDYQQFVHVMLRLLATSLASVVLFDEEVRQKENAIGQAAELQEKLLAELQMEEKRFQRFAERADIAIFILAPTGKFTYRNQRWFDMFEVAVDEDDAMSAWSNIVFPGDIAKCEGVFAKLVVEKVPINVELKTQMRWVPSPELSEPDCELSEHYRWILCSAYPEIGPNGEIIEVVGAVTDISRQKWAEGIQRIRTESALESKQHLEHFIDTTSHEMRNPLSAIMQCADGILASYTSDVGFPPSQHTWSTFLEQTLDATQTISQCAVHMRHIVDDILTISKLDSGLLVITPIDAQPESILRHAIKMFDAEAKAARVDLSYDVDASYRDMKIDWVSLDSTRVLQVLINLLTNAIKFTRLEKTRRVSVVLSASAVVPRSVPGGIQFNEEKLVEEDHHLIDDWKKDPNPIFIQFAVTDTGRGLTEDEHGSLFTRFSQASPRTHIHYGGSGLGLFISRRLTELQGGAIGLASQFKQGSTFSFYIKTRQTNPTMVRRGSLPNALPEDIRHRPGTQLADKSRPPPSLRELSYKVDDERRSAPPSPRMLRQPTLHNIATPGRANSVYEVLESSLLYDVKELETSEGISDTMHVLVVEDNIVNQRVLAKQLRNMGCIVSVANHGREALAFLERTKYWNRDGSISSLTSRHSSCHIPCTEPLPSTAFSDAESPIELSVILMDWEMPIMNGLEAVTHIRQMEKDGVLRGRVPIIGVTANVREQQVKIAMTAGMDDVVGKPFRVAELMVRMKDIARGAGTAPNGHARDGGDVMQTSV